MIVVAASVLIKNGDPTIASAMNQSSDIIPFMIVIHHSTIFFTIKPFPAEGALVSLMCQHGPLQ
jgi:hypothetical protein